MFNSMMLLQNLGLIQWFSFDITTRSQIFNWGIKKKLQITIQFY